MRSIIFGLFSAAFFFFAGYCAAACVPDAKGWLVMGGVLLGLFLGIYALAANTSDTIREREER